MKINEFWGQCFLKALKLISKQIHKWLQCGFTNLSMDLKLIYSYLIQKLHFKILDLLQALSLKFCMSSKQIKITLIWKKKIENGFSELTLKMKEIAKCLKKTNQRMSTEDLIHKIEMLIWITMINLTMWFRLTLTTWTLSVKVKEFKPFLLKTKFKIRVLFLRSMKIQLS